MNTFDSSRLPAFGPLALRLGLAGVFFAHSLAKLFIYTLPGTVQFFEAHGFPGWTAYPVTAGEFFGGLLLLLGFRTRVVSLGLIVILLGAVKTHMANGWMFDTKGGGWEYPAFLIVALAAQALLGSGAHSVDRMTVDLGGPSVAALPQDDKESLSS